MIEKKDVIRISIILSISLLGDAFLYLALPLHYEDLNLSLFWVGIILSVNRFSRILLNPFITQAILKYGFKKLIIYASIFACLSTFLYGVSKFIIGFLFARFIWAISYSILRISTISYATMNRKNSGRYIGIYMLFQEIGPVLVLLLGPYIIQSISVEYFFIILGIITSICIPISILSRDISTNHYNTVPKLIPKINHMTLFIFNTSFFIDGALIVSIGLIFLSQGLSKDTSIFYASIIILLKRFINLLLSIKIGILNDLYSSSKILYLSIYGLIIGSIFIFFDYVWIGSILLMITLTTINIGIPKYITENTHDHFHILNDFTTWRDIASAFGAFFGTSCFYSIDYHTVFGISILIWLYYLITWYNISEKRVTV